jgi:translation initiation factor 1
MGKENKKSKPREAVPGSAPAGVPFNNPFAQLRAAQAPPMAESAAAPSPGTDTESTTGATSSSPRFGGKLVLRRERKGHGGKTVTVLEGVAQPPEALAELARELARALGSGVRVDGSSLVIAGDQRERLATWLRAHGASQVVLGN